MKNIELKEYGSYKFLKFIKDTGYSITVYSTTKWCVFGYAVLPKNVSCKDKANNKF